MGAKAKMSLKKKLVKASKKVAVCRQTKGSADFLPLDASASPRLLHDEKEPEKDVATVLYVGHIPHGFFEEQMEGFFKQFGKIKRLRVARNKKTGKSRHYGFIEFENPEVAKVVADEINGYHMFEHILQIQLIPSERVHPKLWKGVSKEFKTIDWKAIAIKQQNKERSLEEHRELVQRILNRDEKRRKRLEEVGIDYMFPEFIGGQPLLKKIKFDYEEK